MAIVAAHSSRNSSVLDRVNRLASSPGWAGQGCLMTKIVGQGMNYHNKGRFNCKKEIIPGVTDFYIEIGDSLLMSFSRVGVTNTIPPSCDPGSHV